MASPFKPGDSLEEQLAYYKAQYEQLEQELQEFQASSKELEAELEKDVEASELRERKLKDQTADYESQVAEWRVCRKYRAHCTYLTFRQNANNHATKRTGRRTCCKRRSLPCER